MARGNQKQTTIGRDFARKPYVSGGFYEMMNLPANAAVWASRGAEKHSEFEKPYLKDHSYAAMQHYHPSGLRLPYRGPQPNADPLGAVDPCRGTVHATLDGITSPVHYVECGTQHEIGMDGGVPPFELSGVAGVLTGDVSENIYTAPPCETCKNDVTDHIQIVDACGRRPNLIVKVVFPKGNGIIDIEGPDAPVDGDCYEVIGGVLPIQWSMSAGSISDEGCVTVTGECGTATITAEDACGSSLTKEVRMPIGVWTLLAGSEIAHCASYTTPNCFAIRGVLRNGYQLVECCADFPSGCGSNCASAHSGCSGIDPQSVGCASVQCLNYPDCCCHLKGELIQTWECP